jgi:hypothetical protein
VRVKSFCLPTLWNYICVLYGSKGSIFGCFLCVRSFSGCGFFSYVLFLPFLTAIVCFTVLESVVFFPWQNTSRLDPHTSVPVPVPLSTLNFYILRCSIQCSILFQYSISFFNWVFGLKKNFFSPVWQPMSSRPGAWDKMDSYVVSYWFYREGFFSYIMMR